MIFLVRGKTKTKQNNVIFNVSVLRVNFQILIVSVIISQRNSRKIWLLGERLGSVSDAITYYN